LARIEFFFDISSPWTYLAFENIQPLAAEFDVNIEWKPILVGGIFNTVNPSVYEMRANPIPAKWKYMAKDLANWADETGVRIKWQPTVFPVNSVKSLRGCIVADAEGKLVPFARACFELYWGDDKDISQDDIIAEACDRAGLDAASLAEAITDQGIKDQLKANTEDVVDRGGFGSPTIFVNGDDMYFGNDRMPLIRSALTKA